ncbi:hypothetical protein LPJ59_000213 [Coemansia sp. RSA 2399]|nr:hypothetical protein LPJ59_000213 [Coemansia sp. RSA 2399]KAJ1908308.1 hypothetical protein LPJ81_000168 [Coemansia sp. IMI 209127]
MTENTNNPKSTTSDIKEKLHKRQWVVENDNSMARDQFAVERNFLAWFKLSMAIVASGIVIYKDFDEAIGTYSLLARISTAYFLILAIVLLLLSTAYLYVIKAALSKENRPLKLFHLLFLQIAGCVGAVSLIFVLAIAYHQQELVDS